MHMDAESIVAAILHDVIEDTPAIYADVAARFIAALEPALARLLRG